MPFANSLTREVSLKVGPTVLEVFVKHYFDRLKDDAQTGESGSSLKQDDVLYHEAFTIVKGFLAASTHHTIEELQSFSNTRTPSPPWTHIVRIVVPVSCCDEAAPYLIKALGGEDVAKRLIGGVKWWQVRGINGVDGQWITAQKDYQEAKKRYKEQKKATPTDIPIPPPITEDIPNSTSGTYEKDMDAMRCILYLHGGGYYFGSVDQERYSIERLARKINGRVFAINYRLAPQYPFPCALHDAVAAYLYLIRPPPNSAHRAVHPRHIIISGDSAGGGLSLALLQVIRDSGLPSPAGGVLISPWCDLTHSFPSVHLNTETDIIPESGLSFHKPSMLWPPPPEEISTRVNASIRFRIRQAFRSDESPSFNATSTYDEGQGDENDLTTTLTPSTPFVETGGRVDPERVIVHDPSSGEIIEVSEQLHFYATNSLLAHPLVSPAMSYLGGLPPLLFIAGDKEVLRDEIIYAAHKAAYPEKYPVDDRARELYPVLNDIEQRSKATPVHLQVYDDSPHILPVLFSFSTPAKFCFRAMANFTKFVTKMPLTSALSLSRKGSTASVSRKPITRRQSLFAGFKQSMGTRQNSTHVPNSPPAPLSPTLPTSPTSFTSVFSPVPPSITLTESPPAIEHEQLESHVPTRRQSLRRALSGSISRPSGLLRRSPSPVSPSTSGQQPVHEGGQSEFLHEGLQSSPLASTITQKPSVTSSDVGGPRFQPEPLVAEPSGERYAGEIDVYSDIPNPTEWPIRMIRERVSTAGIVSPLESEAELDAFQMPTAHIGRFSAGTMHRYQRDQRKFAKKFAHTSKHIDKQRRRNLQRAKEDTIRRMGALRQVLRRDGRLVVAAESEEARARETPAWAWAWALDEDEDPPPSSIVARRDTEEARKLAEVADQAILGQDHTFSGNNLWAVVISFLTITPGKENHWLSKKPRKPSDGTDDNSVSESQSGGENSHPQRRKSRLDTLRFWDKEPEKSSSKGKDKST